MDVPERGARAGQQDATDIGNLARRGLLGALAAEAMTRGRRGPGQPGSARRVPGWSDSSAGGSALLGFAERVADDEERLGGATDDEIVELICALDQAEASACLLKYATRIESTITVAI